MDWLKNITLNMKATGPATVLCVYIIAVAALGMFGSDKLGVMALTLLTVIGPILIGAMTQ